MFSKVTNRHIAASALLLSQSVVRPALAALYEDPADLPTNKSYDYIVIGAGAGGAPVAARLSEDSSVNVLIIEAGVNNVGLLDVAIPALDVSLSPNTAIDWNFTTTPQTALDGRVVNYPRGKLLGGSTSINYMIWSRGASSDFDRYANVTGDNGWSWAELEPYFIKSEIVVPPSDGHDTTGEIDMSFHGTAGPLGISLPGYSLALDEKVISTTLELEEFPFVLDMNSGSPLGVGWTQNAVNNGARTSAATGYINPNWNRTNFDVLINTQATKLIQTGTSDNKPVFLGVQFAKDASSPLYALNATTEVILSGGVFGTPQLLMLSGIGPADELTSLGIDVIVDSPDVGQHLVDHSLLSNVFEVNAADEFTMDDLRENNTLSGDALSDWMNDRSGEDVLAIASQIAWLRLADNSTVFDLGETDPSSGSVAPHYEFLIYDGFVSPFAAGPDSGKYLSMITSVCSPAARGNLSLVSNSPWDMLTINPNILGTDWDVATMVESIKAAFRFVQSPAFDGYIISPYGDLANATTDADFEAWARANTASFNHPLGTASMGPASDTPVAGEGVVNPDLTVKGVVGLRVSDASVMPYIPAAAPQAAVYAMAERAADLIKAAHPSTSR